MLSFLKKAIIYCEEKEMYHLFHQIKALQGNANQNYSLFTIHYSRKALQEFCL